jgi:hypothetical protein
MATSMGWRILTVVYVLVLRQVKKIESALVGLPALPEENVAANGSPPHFDAVTGRSLKNVRVAAKRPF